MTAQVLAKFKELVDDLEAEWQPHLAKLQSPDRAPYTLLSKKATEARDNFGAANELYHRFLKQFTVESRDNLIGLGLMKKPTTFLAQKAEDE